MDDKLTEPERAFLELIREGRRKLFEGVGATIPLELRPRVMAGMVIKHEITGEVVCTLADSDETCLRRFREAARPAR